MMTALFYGYLSSSQDTDEDNVIQRCKIFYASKKHLSFQDCHHNRHLDNDGDNEYNRK